jgi:hypothetical protein
MPGYFEGIPNFEYVDRDPNKKNISDFTPVKNLFKRGKIREEIFGDARYFERYIIEGDERPDNIAFQLYGDDTLDWVILLSNNIINVLSEWPMTQKSLDEYLLEKYGDYNSIYNGIHHYETKEIKNSRDVVVLKSGLRINNTWKTNGNWIETNTSKILDIYSGDKVTTSPIVTVVLFGSGMTNLKEGDQITISNVSQEIYNGSHIVTELLETNPISFDSYQVKSFKYELSSAPEVPNPKLSFVIDNQGNPIGSQLEEARFTIGTNSELNGNAYYFEYYDNILEKLVQVSSLDFVIPITNYEYESNLDNQKREIFALRSEYLEVLFNDIQTQMEYKEGGEQYISPILKRGDNIRIYKK